MWTKTFKLEYMSTTQIIITVAAIVFAVFFSTMILALCGMGRYNCDETLE